MFCFITKKMDVDVIFRAKYGVEEMCRDQWNWAKNNPFGYSNTGKP